jgi:V/A-type H+-transporting ATPase subunit I
VIVPMLRVRIAGPRSRLDATLRALQDFAALHLDQPQLTPDPAHDRWLRRARRHPERCLADVQAALDGLPLSAHAPRASAPAGLTPDVVRRARRIRRQVDSLQRAAARLDEERRALVRYREFFRAFETLAGHELTWPDRQAFYVILRAGTTTALAELREELDRALDGEVEVLDAEISTGERAVLILASSRVASRVSALLSASRVEELPAPPGIADPNLLRALPGVKARLDEIASSMREIERERSRLAASEGEWLASVRAFLHDEALRLDAHSRLFAAEYLFILEGWVPAVREHQLRRHLQSSLGSEIEITTLAGSPSALGITPVALHNPAIFRPFEVVTSLLPLPKYGTIDPTPFVAIFMPAFFGLMVGDVGYGLMLLAAAALLRRRSRTGSILRPVSAVTAACASATIVFGVVFGEVFGSLGPALGLHPIFNREEATFPFLALCLALGGVHVMLGLVLGAVTAWRGGHRRQAAGGGVALGMLVLTALLLLAALRVLPPALFTPLVIATLCAFVVLVALEGIVAVIELLSTFGHILSYARIMALGLASLMLAVVANQMVGALGSVLVGAVFALLFHLVNFTIAVLSPTIHALRLHYVEFFGYFFTPGGAEYRPLAHWRHAP